METESQTRPGWIKALVGSNLRISIVRFITIACGGYVISQVVTRGEHVMANEDVQMAAVAFVIGGLATLLQVLGDRAAHIES